MVGEILIIITGFFRWILKGCKTDLKTEIQGDNKNKINIRGRNYIIGILIFFAIILLVLSQRYHTRS